MITFPAILKISSRLPGISGCAIAHVLNRKRSTQRLGLELTNFKATKLKCLGTARYATASFFFFFLSPQSCIRLPDATNVNVCCICTAGAWACFPRHRERTLRFNVPTVVLIVVAMRNIMMHHTSSQTQPRCYSQPKTLLLELHLQKRLLKRFVLLNEESGPPQTVQIHGNSPHL